jgi:hypothetical protein
MGTSIFPICSRSNWSLIHVLNSQIWGCSNGHHYFAVPCSYLTHRPSFATGENWTKGTKEAHVWVQAVCQIV